MVLRMLWCSAGRYVQELPCLILVKGCNCKSVLSNTADLQRWYVQTSSTDLSQAQRVSLETTQSMPATLKTTVMYVRIGIKAAIEGQVRWRRRDEQYQCLHSND